MVFVSGLFILKIFKLLPFFFFLFFLDYPDSKGDMKVESDAIFGITQKTAFY